MTRALAFTIRCRVDPMRRLVQFYPESGQHSQKSTVHEHAFRQIDDEPIIAFLVELVSRVLKSGLDVEIGAARDFQAGKLFADQYR